MSAYWKTVWVLFGIFVVAHLTFLHRVPGLMGDEASEGENVYQLLQADHLVIQGERSYIGPLIDYVRVPFIQTFGYTPLALRMIVLLASLATFWLAASVLRTMFGEVPALFALALGFFSPTYLTQERIGWAIALFPFFLFLILYLIPLQERNYGRVLLAGLAAGIGLSNHILFLPTLVAVVVVGVIAGMLPANSAGSSPRFLSRLKGVLAYWPGLVGFVAGFIMQFWVLVNYREDQGDPEAMAQFFSDRFADLPSVLPFVLSGSSYVARYTGVEFSSGVIWLVTAAVVLLGLIALTFSSRRKMAWLWVLGMAIHLVVLMLMVDRFTLRYFVMFVFAAWMLAGVGVGALVERFLPSLHLRSVSKVLPIGVATCLVLWSVFAVLLPFLKTGGSTADFSLGNRTDSAAALVDTRPLVECLRGKGPASSEKIHIWNRMQFLSHEYSDLQVLPQDDSSHAQWLVHYRAAKQPDPGDLCPELAHFRVILNQ